ncbi:MAG: DUF4333 domain-containing protein [Acidimicrobiales bacterium]
MEHPPPATAPAPKRGYLVPGLIALVFLVGAAVLINYTALSHHVSRRLNGPDVATLISQGLQAQLGARVPPQVSCPAHEPLRAGLTFECVLDRHGRRSAVQVTETNRAGQLSFRTLSGP